MALNITPPPNFNVNIPQMPDALTQYGKMLSLKNMASEQALREQLAPLNVQEAQGRVQGQQITNALQALQLKTAQAENEYWSHPEKYEPDSKEANGDGYRVEQMLGLSADDPTAGMVRGLIKAGVPGPVAMHYGQASIDFRKTAAQTSQEQQKVLDDAWTHLRQISGPIMAETKPEVKTQLLAAAKPSLMQWASFDPSLKAIIPQLTVDNFDVFANRIAAQKEAHDFQTGQTTALKGQLETAPPSATQVQTFTDKTVPSFASLRPEQKNAFVSEAKNARTVDELNKVVERADSTDKAEQMHKDSLAQTQALSGQHFQQKGIEDNDKTWTDPQHGFVTIASQVKLVKAALKEGTDGNGLAASMAPTMTALGINSFNQMHRISPAEAQSAAMPGGYTERFNAWADKAFTGKLSAQVAKEGTQLMDEILTQAHTRALQSSQMKVKSFNIPETQMPVMDREGNVTTLDKVGKPAASGGGTAKVLTQAQIQQAAKDHGVSLDEAKRQAKAAGYEVK